MGQTVASGAAYAPVYLAYRCSKCGALNAYLVLLTEKSEVTQSGIVFRQSKRDEMQEEALEEARGAMGVRLRRVFAESRVRRYHAAEFHCRCAKCRNKEAWSKLRFSRVESIMIPVVATAVFFAIMALIFGEFLIFGCILGGCGLIVGPWSLYKKLHIEAMEKRIAELPEDSIPIISLKESELKDKARAKFGDAQALPRIDYVE